MAKQPAKNINYALNSVAIEDDLDSVELSVTQETPVVTSFADAGPRRVVGNYDYTETIEGSMDFASGQSDATIFGLLGVAVGQASAFDPTGATAGANDPNYDKTVVLGSYRIGGRVGEAVRGSAELRGNSALTRAVA